MWEFEANSQVKLHTCTHTQSPQEPETNMKTLFVFFFCLSLSVFLCDFCLAARFFRRLSDFCPYKPKLVWHKHAAWLTLHRHSHWNSFQLLMLWWIRLHTSADSHAHSYHLLTSGDQDLLRLTFDESISHKVLLVRKCGTLRHYWSLWSSLWSCLDRLIWVKPIYDKNTNITL